MSETTFDEMKRYVRFTEQDARSLAVFGVVARPHFQRIAVEFYERIREHEDAHRVFSGEEQIARLQRTLVLWMERLCFGPHDESYYVERSKIGRIHVKIGLPQRYMFTAMALIRTSLDALARTLPEPESLAARDALARLLDLELGIMLESYREDFVARIQRIERIEREQLEHALARSERRYAQAVELTKALVVGLDAIGRVVIFNHEAEQVTGYARDEVVGKDFVALLMPDALDSNDAARFQSSAFAQVAGSLDIEAPIRTRSGRERMVHWQLAPLAPTSDQDVALFCTGQDVTDERALAERTRQSERLAAVGTLAAGLAHEIRNPLNGALLHVTFLDRALRKSGASEDTVQAAGFIGSEIQRLSALVKDFLVFARPAPPTLALSPLRDVCQRVLALVADDARSAQASLEADLGVSEISMRIDSAKIEQVLLNLLRNAIDAVQGVQGANVTLRLRRQPRHALLEVQDNGPGLPDADAPIFDAFYSTKANGTGLGLAIVHRIVTDHGGTISFESKPGRTIFRVSLPIALDSEAEHA